MAGDDYCYLTTTGRRSGRPHRIEIWYAADEGHVYVLAGGGESSDWVRNLIVTPEVDVELGEDRHHSRARVIVDLQESEVARTLVFEKYSQRYEGDLTNWHHSALPIAIDL